MEAVLRDYAKAKKRLLVLGYNATLTTAVEAPRQPKRHFDQIQVLSQLIKTCSACCMVFDIKHSAWHQQHVHEVCVLP